MILHSITPPELPNSTMSIFPNFETLSATSIDDLISKIISNITDFAISLAIAIAVFYIGKFVIKKLHKIVLSVLIRREVDQSLSTFILSFVKIVLYFILIIIGSICLLCFLLYAPADTKKRPLIYPRRRLVYKIITVIMASIYLVLLFIINDSFIQNTLVCAMLIESVLIHPLTYKIFKLSYKNYETYVLAKDSI